MSRLGDGVLYVRGVLARDRKELQRLAREADMSEAQYVRGLLSDHAAKSAAKRKASRQ